MGMELNDDSKRFSNNDVYPGYSLAIDGMYASTQRGSRMRPRGSGSAL